MNRRIFLVCICLCISFCACHRTIPENELNTNDNAIEFSDNSISEKEMVFLDKYNDLAVRENDKRVALIYLDEDSIPELLVLKDGEYRVYSFDGYEIKQAVMSNTEIKANSYGPIHNFEESRYQTFYWFEYVPYKGLIRVHGGDDQERHDYYLKYTDGLFETELEAKSIDYAWHTYNAEKEIENDVFLSQLSDLGYDKLIPCSYLYENVEAAYENIGATSDTKIMLNDFVSGKIDALDYVKEMGDVPEKSFVMRSYEDFFDDITEGEEAWGSAEYMDFDNDGEEELIIHGYAGACLFFDVIGDTVYKVLKTGSTTDVAYIAVFKGKRVIVRTDLTHAGRQSYRIMEFDSCCCLTDWFRLYAEYDGTEYSDEDMFMYRNNEISMDEFETVLNNIHQP